MGLDYKLIIILGLAVVIYFIYKEVDVLFDKMINLEDRIKLFENKQITNNIEPEDVESELVILPSNIKNIIIDMNTNLNNHDIIYTNLTDSNSKYLEIYSNDNSSYNTSIKDSIISDNSTKSEVMFNYNTDVTADVTADVIADVIAENKDPVNVKEEIKIANYESELKNKKMTDITKIATENNIELGKKINGVSKKKLKQELINEIIQKKKYLNKFI